MILLSQLIDRYQKDLERNMAKRCSQATIRPSGRCDVAGGKAVIRWFSNANPAQPDSEFPIPAVIAVALTANITTANNGSHARPPSCYRLPIL